CCLARLQRNRRSLRAACRFEQMKVFRRLTDIRDVHDIELLRNSRGSRTARPERAAPPPRDTSARGIGSDAPFAMKINSLRDVLIHELKDLYSAEKQLIKALPKMAKAAADEDLSAGFEEHLQQTEE